MFRFLLHYGIHFLVPIIIALLFFKDNKVRAILILWAGMLIDIDHLWANPIFDPDRCSINFHPLHTYWAILVYAIMFLFPKTRIFGLAALIHILADTVDCLWVLFPLE